ncbi:MAG: hypothetical protein AAFX40_09360 [Cyanobacteria bacterium J06639_1]
MRWFAVSLTIAIASTPMAAIAEASGSEDTATALYANLNEAVVAEDWQGAIATIDRLIADDPVRAAGLGGYRELLVARANAQTDDVPTLPVLNSEPTEISPAESETASREESTVDPESDNRNSEERDREIERRVVRAGDRVGRRYSRDYREARFWMDLLRE